MPIRTCRENELFTESVDNLRKIYPRIDEIFQAVTWTLARHPFAGTRLPNDPEYYVFETTPIGTTPSFWILYHFDDDIVDLLSIGPVNKSEGED